MEIQVTPILNYWGPRVCVGKLTNFGSESGWSPGRGQVIIWSNAGILLIGLPHGEISRVPLQWRHNGHDCVSIPLAIVYSIVYSSADQRKHQSSASLALVWGIRRWPVNSPCKGPVTRKMFPFDDVIMWYCVGCTLFPGDKPFTGWCFLGPILLTWFNFNLSIMDK